MYHGIEQRKAQRTSELPTLGEFRGQALTLSPDARGLPISSEYFAAFVLTLGEDLERMAKRGLGLIDVVERMEQQVMTLTDCAESLQQQIDALTNDRG